jgi:hypothetical protein
MNRRTLALAPACVAAACLAAPTLGTAAAAPPHHRSLTIHATPQSIIAGSSVVIHGRLSGRHHGDRRIVLWHRLAGQPGFTVIGRTRTDATGRYAFTRAEGIVNTNRRWYVRGPGHSRSRTIAEHVAAEVTLAANATETTTRHPVTFTGHITPSHAGSRVELQVQKSATTGWRTVARTVVRRGSNYSIRYAWRRSGPREVRVRFAGDRRNDAATSSPVSIVVDQRQRPFFSINTSSPIVPSGTSSTISGTLLVPHTSTGDGGVSVGLYSRPNRSGHWALAQTTTTAADGTYAFAVQDTTNTIYQVRTLSGRHDWTALLFQGVQDVVTLSTSATSSTAGDTVTLSGTVTPDKSGHVVYLQLLGRDGHWHPVQTTTIATGSTFSFSVELGNAATQEYRALVLGGPANIGAASPPVTETVAQSPVGSLPTG